MSETLFLPVFDLLLSIKKSLKPNIVRKLLEVVEEFASGVMTSLGPFCRSRIEIYSRVRSWEEPSEGLEFSPKVCDKNSSISYYIAFLLMKLILRFVLAVEQAGARVLATGSVPA